MSKLPRSQLESTAFHEAGHAVAAYCEGLRVAELSIIPDLGTHGHVRHRNPLRGLHIRGDSLDPVRLRVERQIIVLLAGPIAQRHFRPRGWRAHHGADDHLMAAKLAVVFYRDRDIASAWLNYLRHVAGLVMFRHRRAIRAVARALMSRGRLGGREFDTLVRRLIRKNGAKRRARKRVSTRRDR